MSDLPELTRTAEGLVTVSSTGPEQLRDLLDLYEVEMQAAGCTVLSQLAPGLPGDSIRDQISALGLTPPEELVVFFGWHNGFREGATEVPNGNVLPSANPARLAWSVETYRRAASSNLPRRLLRAWDPQWFAFEEVWPGYSIDCSADPSQPPRVAYISEENPFSGIRRRPMLESLCTLVTVWIQLVQRGAVTWQGTYWQFDASKVTEEQRSTGIVDVY